MRDNMERLVVLPLSLGCISQTNIGGLSSNQLQTQEKDSNHTITSKQGESSFIVRMKKSIGSTKPKLSKAIQRLIKSFTGFFQLFVYKEKAEMEKEMEIGFPTDVKHVTHIGWDGSTSTNPVKGWEKFEAPEILALPSISLRQFELAMSAQATNNSPSPNIVDSSENCSNPNLP